MDEDDLTKSEAMVSDAAGEIEIHFNPVQSDDMPTASVPKITRKLNGGKIKLLFYLLL